MSKEREPVSGAAERARRATGEAPEKRRDGRGRWSAKRKFAAVLRLLRGEDLETLSHELGVTAATLSGWRDQFLVDKRRAYTRSDMATHPSSLLQR
jgi:transposase-like protein